MNRKKLIIDIADLVIFSVYSIIGMFLFIFWIAAKPIGDRPLTGDPLTNFLFFFSIPVHFLTGVLVSRFFYKKERTKLGIRINKPVFIANIVLILGLYSVALVQAFQ